MTVMTELPELQGTRARMPDPAVREFPGKNRSGFLPLAVGLVLLLGCVGGGIWRSPRASGTTRATSSRSTTRRAARSRSRR